MKTKLVLINSTILFFLIGLILSVNGSLQLGALSILFGSTLLLGNYVAQIRQLVMQSKLWGWQTIAITTGLFSVAILFMHGFSAAIGMVMVFKITGFTFLYFATGFLLPLLLLYFSNHHTLKEDRKWIAVGTSLGALLCLIGLLGFTRIIAVPVQTILYSWVVTLFFYVLFLLRSYFLQKEKWKKTEDLSLLVLTAVFLGFWIFRFEASPSLENGLIRAIVELGFVPLVILPLTLVSIKRHYAFVIFLLYFISLDFYFIQYDSNFKYLVDVGLNGCEGYDQATDYPTVTDPGLSIEELLKEPTKQEIEDVALEWASKDFTPKNIEVVYSSALANGDSIKVISHLVNGLLHYGAIRIPKGLDVKKAPILLELEGGGTGLDISKTRTLTSGKCKVSKNQFISILPSYRGCIIRGDEFCFRSQGYFGDPWIGPAEDATAFLEAVLYHYRKPESTRVLASGISRGATVALIMGSLTQKLDYIIATSTHTKFLDPDVLENQRVGNSFGRAFFTPKAAPEMIRKKILASSPYYFADRIPQFEIHQGGQDQQTTVWHAEKIQDRLEQLGRDSATYDIYLYNDQGHGYDDDQVVCASFERFLEN